MSRCYFLPSRSKQNLESGNAAPFLIGFHSKSIMNMISQMQSWVHATLWCLFHRTVQGNFRSRFLEETLWFRRWWWWWFTAFNIQSTFCCREKDYTDNNRNQKNDQKNNNNNNQCILQPLTDANDDDDDLQLLAQWIYLCCHDKNYTANNGNQKNDQKNNNTINAFI